MSSPTPLEPSARTVIGKAPRLIERYELWFGLVGLPLMAFGIYETWSVIHGRDPNQLVDTVLSAAFFLFIAFVGLVLLGIAIDDFPNVSLTCACPCCGAVDTRLFPSGDRPQPCGTCDAYLRARGVEVSEESLDAVETEFGYKVDLSEHAKMKSDAEGTIKFQLPRGLCAGCGSAQVSGNRKFVWDLNDVALDEPGFGDFLSFLGEVAEQVVVTEAWEGTGNHYGRLAPNVVSSTRTPQRTKWPRIEVAYPVCEKHTEQASLLPWPLEFTGKEVTVLSYRYYKALMALNGLSGRAAKKKKPA